jgi:glutaredoxin
MKIFLLLLVLGGGIWYWQTDGLLFMSAPAAYDSSGAPVVWIFTFEKCGTPCTDAVADLKARNAPFIHKSINPNDASDPDVKLWSAHGKTQFPLIVVGEDKISSFSSPALASLLTKYFDDRYLLDNEKRFYKNHFNTDGSPRIVMYSTDWCRYCKKLRNDFQSNNIQFTEIDVEKISDGREVTKVLGITGVPATWVGFKRVDGTDLASVNRTLNK